MKKFTTLTVFCVMVLLQTSAMAQDEIPSYEASSGSTTSASPDNTGPETTFSHELLLNSNNPNGNTFSTPDGTPITVTYTLSNFPYDVSQDTDESGGAGTTDDPSAVLGWNFGGGSSTGGLTVTGTSRTTLRPLDAFTQSIPASDDFTSLKSVAFLNAGSVGEGIDATANYGVNVSVSYEGLRDSTDFDTRYNMGTLTITFSSPVDDPVLHFNGLGGRWFATFSGTPATRYYNTATTDLDFEPTSSTPGIGTPVVLSGTDNFVIDDPDSDGTDVIRNNSDNPDANGNSSTGSITFAVAHGSVLFPGQDISTIVFTMKARFMTARDLVDPTDGIDANGDSYDQTIFGDTDGWGWAGGGTDTQGGNAVPETNFSSDVFVVSASVPAPLDVDLTGAECYRMLSSPVVGTTYSTLLEPLWTQGISGSDANFGDANVWLWPDVTGEDGGSSGSGHDPGDWTPVPSGTGSGHFEGEIPPGTGFLISVFNDSDYTNSNNSSEEGFPKTLTVDGSEHDPFTFTNMNSNAEGWTLLGNPFKATIDWDNLFPNTADVQDAVYVFDRNKTGGAGFISYSTTGGGDLTNGLIPRFDGFFVQNEASGSFSNNASVDFTEGAKSTTAQTFYGKEKELHNYVRFEVNGDKLGDSMWLMFSNKGSLERTSGDALKLNPYSLDYALLGSEKVNGTVFDIGHYPIPSEKLEIPVNFETTQPGYYTISASDLDIAFGSDLYFVDLQEKENIRIDENFSYGFTINGVAASKTSDGNNFNRCTLDSPQKVKSINSARFMITTQPKDFASELPQSVALNQNYPNPFNPTTQISYDLPQTADVRLEVYDLVGRQVATLVNQTVEAGSHTVNFDAANLSSGVYIYRLNAGNTVLSRKLTVIK